jgi:hypothetical protein
MPLFSSKSKGATDDSHKAAILESLKKPISVTTAPTTTSTTTTTTKPSITTLYKAIDEDNAKDLPSLLEKARLSCFTLYDLLDRASGMDKIGTLSILIDTLERDSCNRDYEDHLDLAARGAALEGNTAAVLYLIARGASNYDELIDVAKKAGYNDLANLIAMKRKGGSK